VGETPLDGNLEIIADFQLKMIILRLLSQLKPILDTLAGSFFPLSWGLPFMGDKDSVSFVLRYRFFLGRKEI